MLEKKEREMQCLNVNLKRENDMAIAVLNKKYAKRISNMERFAEGMKKKLEEKKQALEQADNSWLAAKREAKELRHRIAQMEMEDKNRQKKDR